MGTLSRSNNETTLNMTVPTGDQKLSILVENQGRIDNLKFLKDRKVVSNKLDIVRYIYYVDNISIFRGFCQT